MAAKRTPRDPRGAAAGDKAGGKRVQFLTWSPHRRRGVDVCFATFGGKSYPERVETLPPTLPPEGPPEVLNPVDILLARSHMRAFMRNTAPGFVDMYGCAITCDYLTRVARRVRGFGPEDGAIDVLFLFGPPQHWKSYLTGQFFPAFVAAQMPAVRILNLCHNRDLSQRAIRDFCTVLDLDNYRRVSRVRYGRVAAEDGSTEREEAAAKRVRFLAVRDGAVSRTGGYYLSSSVEGSSTGWGCELGIADDLVPHPEAAESASQRRALENTVRSVFLTRRQTHSGIVVCMTPWHKDDVGAHMEQWCRDAGLAVESLHLPAVAEPGIALHPDDPREPGSGQILDPYRHNPAFYRGQRVLMGDYFWRTMALCQRSAGTNDLVSPSTWGSFDPAALKLRTVDLVDMVLSVDPNGKEGGPCYAHLSLWAVVRRGRRLEAWKISEMAGAWAYDVLELNLGMYLQAWPVGWVVIEPNNYGTALVSRLQHRTPIMGPDNRPLRFMRQPAIEATQPREGKLSRAKSARSLVEAGLVRLPGASLGEVSTAWGDAHRRAWETWPGRDQGDTDRVDCDSQALRFIQDRWHLLEALIVETRGLGGPYR